MPLSLAERDWYYGQIERLDPNGDIVRVDRDLNLLIYSAQIRSDESRKRSADPEELVRGLGMCLLASDAYGYSPESFYIEKYYRHGHPSSKHDEVDLLILDKDDLPYAHWEFKAHEEYEKDSDKYIQFQLFGTAPLVGASRMLVFATIRPGGADAAFTLRVIDRSRFPSFEGWTAHERPTIALFPARYADPSQNPLRLGGAPDLRLDCSQADFRAVAATFHAEFFGEHPDNVLYSNLVKCLLAKIYDERTTKTGAEYQFQVFFRKGTEETAQQVFDRVNQLYSTSYSRFIEPGSSHPDEINPKEFGHDRVKTVVKALQSMSLTRGAALNGDVIGAFFEEILRSGFKQDKGMYFTHANLVRFILEALDLRELVVRKWQSATHPENRLPYIIDPSCGAGTFLLQAMQMVTETVRHRRSELVADFDAKQFFDARMSDDRPNYWAEAFIYGLDPKFIMAITAKVNMVLHGDGSAHVFKHDALRTLGTFPDSRFRPAAGAARSLPRDSYVPEMCETFDVVVSNPPFGITIPSETKPTLATSFSLPESMPSESLFLERYFQLLRPGGRLGVVLPESLLNSTDNIDARLFLYRHFWIRAIVSLPRNLFVETPTLTSLLFAQKKSGVETAGWDHAWATAEAVEQARVDKAQAYLRSARRAASTASEVEEEVLRLLAPTVSRDTRITKKGREPVTVGLPSAIKTAEDACAYYSALLRLGGFKAVVLRKVFESVVETCNYEYLAFMVDEVGYKLSKRKERLRPNQLCRFVDASGVETPNLHMASGDARLLVNSSAPERVLDFIRRDVKWS